MINIENCKKLVRKLESGKYAKGVGRLRDKYDNYCVLGVACDITSNKKWGKLHDDPCHPCYIFDEDYTSSTPSYVNQYFGFSAAQVGHLMHLSDISETFWPVIQLLKEWINDAATSKVKN